MCDQVNDHLKTPSPIHCDIDNCKQILSSKYVLKRHKETCHQIDPTLYKCDEKNCGTVCKRKDALTEHKKTVHSENRPFECNKCSESFKVKRVLTQHKRRFHDIDIIWRKCSVPKCNEKFKEKRQLADHKAECHNDRSNLVLYCCDYKNCTKEFKQKLSLERHKAVDHVMNILPFKCRYKECKDEFKTENELKDHKKTTHNEIIRPYICDQPNCGKTFEHQIRLTRHTKTFHKIDPDWYPCEEDSCTAKFTRKDSLKIHLQNVHDIGEFECQLCIKKCAKLTKWKDPKTKKSLDICRGCYLKATGHKTRVEKEIVEWLKDNYNQPIIKQDQRVNGEACLKYRPDIMYSCAINNVTIYCEIDEHQHSKSNGTYKCEEKRMSELYDETPGNLVVFIRYNPHTYVSPANETRLKKEERLNLLKDTLNYITTHSKELKEKALIQVFYICYSSTNKLIAKDIPKQLIYKKEDLHF